MTRALFASVTLLLVVPVTLAIDYRETSGPATLEVHGSGKQLALSDVLDVAITVDGSKALRVEQLKPAGPGWDVLHTAAKAQPNEQGGLRWLQTLKLAPASPGELKLELPPLLVHDRDGERHWTFKPLTIAVATQIKDVDPRQARDITATEEPPEPAANDLPWPWLVAVPVALLLASSLWFALRRRAERRPASALHRALRECDRLVALRLPERDHGKSFVLLLTGIVRRYLERRYDLPARRRTTAELLRALEGRPDVTADARRWLHEFLVQTDLVKFAGAPITQERCAALVEEVRHFCRSTAAPRVG